MKYIFSSLLYFDNNCGLLCFMENNSASLRCVCLVGSDVFIQIIAGIHPEARRRRLRPWQSKEANQSA